MVCEQVDKLHCVALVHKRGICTLRDLRPEHLPLLRNVLHRGAEAIREAYGVPAAQLRAFVHYLPSYYHLHVHFMHMGKEATFGMVTGTPATTAAAGPCHPCTAAGAPTSARALCRQGARAAGRHLEHRGLPGVLRARHARLRPRREGCLVHQAPAA